MKGTIATNVSRILRMVFGPYLSKFLKLWPSFRESRVLNSSKFVMPFHSIIGRIVCKRMVKKFENQPQKDMAESKDHSWLYCLCW